MYVVERCSGGTTALVSGSIAPSACAASVRGLRERLSTIFLSPWRVPRTLEHDLGAREPIFGMNRLRGWRSFRSACKTARPARYAWGGHEDRSMADFLYSYGVPLAVGAVAVVL